MFFSQILNKLHTVEPRIETIPSPRYYSHLILLRRKAESVIFFFKAFNTTSPLYGKIFLARWSPDKLGSTA